MNQEVPSPFGLGWTRRLALVANPGAPVQDLFNRQLIIGLGTVSAAFFSFGAMVSPFADPDPMMGLIGVVGSLIPAALCGTLVAVFVTRGKSVVPYGHAITAVAFPVGMFGGLPTFGIGVWTNTAWGFTYALLMFLLGGPRHGGIWVGITSLAWVSIAILDAQYGLSSRPPLIPIANSPWAQAASFISVLSFESLIIVWFIQQRRILEDLLTGERERSDALLHNVLPAAVVPRVRRGDVVADQVEEVTVVFADLVGFTTLAAGIPAGRIVEMLKELFGEIDKIAKEEGVEKVKTIGDCYMAVAGAPVACRDHPDRALKFAIRVRDAINGRKYYGSEVAIRIGVHSGPVVAGIIGEQRLLWDLWGDTVNTASRLESSGIPGEVQVSEATIRLCSGTYDLDDRGVVQLKGRSGLRSFIVRRASSTKAATA